MEKTLDRQMEGGVLNAAVPEAWDALRRHLESRAKDLCDEVRHYPTPIAGCDVQLTKLIEQRTHALASLRRFAETAEGQDARSALPPLAAMRVFVRGYTPADDEIEAGLVAGLDAALASAGAR